MLTFATKDSEILFHLLIQTFGLPVSLWMACRGEVGGDTEKRVEGFGEKRHELRTSIRYNAGRETEVFPDVVSKFTGGHFRGDRFVTRNEPDHFG